MNKIGRWTAVAVIAVGLIPLGGCRICADCEDLAYPAYGGAWERTRRDTGRVGSIFDPAGAQSSSLVDRNEPPTPDALERERQEAREGGLGDPDRRRDNDSIESNSDLPDKSDATKDLLERKLEDIEEKKEGDLRQKNLGDINIHVVPKEVLPPTLH